MKKKALIAMSGGVDSGIAAYLSVKNGYECVGATMKLYDNDDIGMEREKICCTLSDIEDARSVAYNLGMQYYVFNFIDNFNDRVIRNFVDTYLAGGTPNPCIDCNRYLKFEKLMQRMYEMGYDYVVTGHYAKIEYDKEKDRYLLKKAEDLTKDQSYVLYSLTQEQLAHTLFPLGNYTKKEIRKIAEEQGFVNAHKKESQDICFVPDGDYSAFIENYLGKKMPEGDFVLKDGTKVGKHKGIIRYTVGQRKGLGISYGKPLFVCSKCVENNTVTVGNEDELFSDTLIADNINLISVDEIREPIRCKAKIRYRQTEEWATVTQNGDEIVVKFDEKQRAIAKGQAVVLYDEDVVIGGGTIK